MFFVELSCFFNDPVDVGLRFYSQKLFTGSMEFIILNSVLEIPIFGSLGPWYIALLNRFSCYFALVKFTTIFFSYGYLIIMCVY